MDSSSEGVAIGREQKEQLIRRSVLFNDLEPDLVRRLADLSLTRRLAKGTQLFDQGDDGDALYGVVEGLIRIGIVSPDGQELTLGLMEPGDIFGEIALLDGLPRTAGAQAAEDSALMVIERAHFLAFLDEEPRLARHIIELLCERLRQNTDTLSEYAFLSLRGRLARKLLALATAHGRAGPDGVRIAVQLSQTDVARMLGVTREAINKQLKGWAKAGIIRLERGAVIIADTEKLAAFDHLTEE